MDDRVAAATNANEEVRQAQIQLKGAVEIKSKKIKLCRECRTMDERGDKGPSWTPGSSVGIALNCGLTIHVTTSHNHGLASGVETGGM